MDDPILPDGSSFFTASFPLPEDHWIYQKDEDGFNFPPPMSFRAGTKNEIRKQLENQIREAGKYAVRAATMCGEDMDFDPDAMIQNLIVGMLGYHTKDGLSGDDWGNPKIIPEEITHIVRDWK